MADQSVNAETFRLVLSGVECPIASSYTVHSGILEVPTAFEMTIGHAGMIAELADAFPAFTPFELLVGDTVVAVGETDGYSPTGTNGSELTIRGRDMLKWLVDTTLPDDRSFSEKTYLDLTNLALDEVGLADYLVVSDNTANLKAITGASKQVKQLTKTKTEQTQTATGRQVTDETQISPATKTIHNVIEGKLGSSWFDLLKEQYKRAGLFLWSTIDRAFVLARPDGQKAPMARILRRRGTNEPGDVTVLGQPTFTWDATQRYTACRVAGRTGTGKDGRGWVHGVAYDAEMIALLNGAEMTPAAYQAALDAWSKAKREGGALPPKPRMKEQSFEVEKIQTKEQAGFIARRRMAESRRNGWSLSYKVAGHTAPALLGGGRCVWAPDMVVHVVDDEFGIDGPMYLESCVYERKPQTTTTLNLMRVEDLIFAEEDVDNPPKLVKKKGIANVRVGKTEVYRVQAQWRRDPNWGNLPVRVRDDFVGVRSGAIGPPTADGSVGEEQFIEDIGARRLR